MVEKQNPLGTVPSTVPLYLGFYNVTFLCTMNPNLFLSLFNRDGNSSFPLIFLPPP